MPKFLTTLFLTLSIYATAQEVKYNKKKNVFEVNEQPVAKFDPRSIGKGQGRSFFVTTMMDTPLLDIKLVVQQDTLFAKAHYWYLIEAHPYRLSFTIDNPAELNGEKYFSKLLLDRKLINADGSINEEQIKSWAAEYIVDYQFGFNRYNDSCKQLLQEPLSFTKRKSGQVTADQMGRIGESDVVIGKWEKYTERDRLGQGFTDYYVFKNNAGRIVATLNTEFNSTLLTFSKRRLSTTGITNKGLLSSKGESDASYMSRVARILVDEGLL